MRRRSAKHHRQLALVWRRGVALALTLALTLLAGYAGGGSNLPAASATPASFAKLIDIGEYRLYAICRGSGSPTVLLDTGLGGDSTGWAGVLDPLARETRVCAYDLAGLGRSDDAPGTPRTSADMAEDLRALLAAIGVDGPIVYVAASIAGYNARVFAVAYPEQVAGIVLVDASHPDQNERFLALFPANEAELDDAIAQAVRELPAFNAGENPERMDITTSAAQVRAAATLGALPLIVLSHGVAEPNPDVPADIAAAYEHAWAEMQLELAALSTNSKQIIAEKSGHCIQCSQPGLVVDAILRLVTTVRDAADAS